MTGNADGKSKPREYSSAEESEKDELESPINDIQVKNREGEEVDDNLLTLEKVHAILINCINLTKKQKLEYAESERYFMKSYLKKLISKFKGY